MRRTRRTLRVGAVAILLVVAGGCAGTDAGGEGGQGGGEVVVSDSAGVEIVLSRAPQWSEGAGWSLEPEPAMVLGPELPGDRVLYQAGDIERFGDGRVVVENRGTEELLVFDAAGAFLEAWGGEGDGPGEYAQLSGIDRCTDERLAALEPRRLTVLEARGTLIETRPLPVELIGAGKQVLAAGDDCASVFALALVNRYEAAGPGTYTYPVVPLHASLDAAAVDTVGTFLWAEWAGDATGRQVAQLPFGHWSNWASDGRRLYYGRGERPEIAVYSSDGALARLIRWQAPPDPIAEADWRSYEQDLEAVRAADPRVATTYQPPDAQPRPEVMPYYGPTHVQGAAFLISDDGHLWVRRFTRWLAWNEERPWPSGHWSVFDPDGRWLGEVATPQGLDVRNVRGGLVFGVFRDELGVEEVRGYRLRSSSN
jgi:6-bladed beta-propeller